MTSEPVTVVVSGPGDRLVDLCVRVYSITDQHRALSVALVVAHATEANRRVLGGRFAGPLAAKISIEFPPWPVVARLLEAKDARRLAATEQLAVRAQPAAMTLPRTTSAQSTTQTLRINPGRLLAELLSAVKQRQTFGELRVLDASDLDANRTQSVAALRMYQVGVHLGEQLSIEALRLLLGSSTGALDAPLTQLLQQANPKVFLPSVDLGPSLAVLRSGFFIALAARIHAEAVAELGRRKRLVERTLATLDDAQLLALPGPASIALGAEPAAALSALRLALQAPNLVCTTGMFTQLMAAHGARHAEHTRRLLDVAAARDDEPLSMFLTELRADGADGPLAAQLFALSVRASDVHATAVARASALLAALDKKVTAAAFARPPHEALALLVSPLLLHLRGSRATATEAEQAASLAHERHLLAGRNFVSFRRDVAAAFEQRLQTSGRGTEAAVTALIAFLIQDGHRLPTLRVDELGVLFERFLSVS